MTVKVSSRLGEESTTVESVVSGQSFGRLIKFETFVLLGQIFCSRCASNIIKGSRFGHDGMVRVCNLCLEKLAKGDDDDDDDRRSIISSVTSFPAHQLGMDFSLGHHSQSPFAASQLFGRTDEPFNLYSIAETKRPISGSDESGFASRPVTPGATDEEMKHWQPILENPAPFRRDLSEEEKDTVDISNSFDEDDNLIPPASKTPLDFPKMTPAINVGMSSIQFPVGSPDRGMDSPRPRSRVRSRFSSYGDVEVPTPFIRSRVQSRLDNIVAGEPGWRTRRESTA